MAGVGACPAAGLGEDEGVAPAEGEDGVSGAAGFGARAGLIPEACGASAPGEPGAPALGSGADGTCGWAAGEEATGTGEPAEGTPATLFAGTGILFPPNFTGETPGEFWKTVLSPSAGGVGVVGFGSVAI